MSCPSQQARSDRRLRAIRRAVLDLSCPVCYESLHKKQDAFVGRCGHSLCRPCWRALPWPVSCPLCRVSLNEPPKPNFLLNEFLHGVAKTLEDRYITEDRAFRKAVKLEEKKMAKEDREFTSAVRRVERKMPRQNRKALENASNKRRK